ncbi:MAG TPA: triple tyrosine motif-containing protein, partial [Anseongella sp.]|nr:triple tyrosine motif-containing protein [Anseongella sp.]
STSSGYVFGTIQNGVIITDKAGGIVRHLNRESGLQNNTVLSLFEDRQQNLWLGLDNGIDYAELNEEFSYYRDSPGLLGSVYDAVSFDGKLYLGTNHGVFRRDLEAPFNSPFEFLPNSHGQAWSLDVLDGQLICGHNEGTFRAGPRPDEFRKISDVTGGWLSRAVPGRPDIRVQGNYTGLAVFRKAGGSWVFSHRIPDFVHPIRYLEFDHQGSLWASRAYEGIYRIRLTDDFRRIDKIDYFNTADGFPSDFNINVFKIDNQLIFATGKGIYTYDGLKGKVVPFERLNKGLGVLQKAHRVIPAGKNRYWFISTGAIALVTLQDFQVQAKIRSPFSRFLPQMVSEYQNIVALDDSTHLFCLDDGFAILADSVLGALAQKKDARLFIRRVVNLSDSSRLLPFNAETPRIRYNKSNIKVSYAAPFYGYDEKMFQVMLEGFDDSWSSPSQLNYKEYTNLPAGTYTFRVRLVEDAA